MDFSILARQSSDCINCPNETPPCPQCPDGQTCSLTIRSCTSCPQAKCIGASIAGTVTQQTSHPRITDAQRSQTTGAIAGGALGGVAAILIITYLVWRFCIRDRKRQQVLEEEQNSVIMDEKTRSFIAEREARASTYTTNSIITTRTAASNTIPIAFIPGVTGGSPIPAVPPLPGASPDQIFFRPGTIRGSGMSGYSMQSHNIRSSVATTVYGANAIIAPLPQTALRAKPAVVSVKAGRGDASAVSPDLTPTESPADPPPASPLSPLSMLQPGSFRDTNLPSSPAFSVGATFFSNAKAATAVSGTARPVVVTRSPQINREPESSPADPTPSTAFPTSAVDGSSTLPTSAIDGSSTLPSTVVDGNLDFDFDFASNSTAPVARESGITVIDNVPQSPSPFQDSFSQRNSQRNTARMTQSSVASIPLFAVVEEAPAMPPPPAVNAELGRNASPFGDENEVK